MNALPARPYRILILGGDADGNLGDRAILEALCLEIKRLRTDAEICVASADPVRCRTRMNAVAIPRGPKGLFALCRAASRSDLVLCGGGGLFQDDDSLIKMPYWALKLLLMRLLCPRIVGFSLGVGPLNYSVSRAFAQAAFWVMESISVRDPLAAEVAQPLTRKHVSIAPDPALMLPAAGGAEALNVLKAHGVPFESQSPLIGVAVRRWFPPKARVIPHRLAYKFGFRAGRSSANEALLLRLLGEALHRMQSELGAHIIFLPTYNSPHEGDAKLCAQIQEYLDRDRSCIVGVDDPALYKAIAGELTVLMGGRMHPTILASALGTPVVGLGYNPKFRGFFSMLGLDAFVLNVEDFVQGREVERLTLMMKNAIADACRQTSVVDQLSETSRRMLQEVLAL